LRDSLLAERETLMNLPPEQLSRVLASAETILNLIAEIERLKLQRLALLQSSPSDQRVLQ
jgi:hypothetical protein